jgi:glutamate/tyrosine decarboxylase-like PLP-dependent enzyme
MNVICFRYQPGNITEEKLDQINRELLVRLQESGIAVPSNARIEGRFAIRVAHTNHRTRSEDFDLLLRTVVEIGRSIAGKDSEKFRSTPTATRSYQA